MQDSKLSLSRWALAIYLLTSHPKGVSSVQLARDLGVTQKTAWHLAHRIRQAWASDPAPFAGPVEVDEAFIGGIEKNKHVSKKLHCGSAAGKTLVAGARDRQTGRFAASVVEAADRYSLTSFIRDRAAPSAAIWTDEGRIYSSLTGALNQFPYGAWARLAAQVRGARG